MSLPLVFRPEVREEVDKAYAWYEDQRSGIGDDFLECIEEMLDRIRQMPKSCAIVYSDVRRGLIRRFPYAVYYRVESAQVIVLAVFHIRRDPKAWQTRT